MVAAYPAFDPVRPVMFATVRRGERDDSILGGPSALATSSGALLVTSAIA